MNCEYLFQIHKQFISNNKTNASPEKHKITESEKLRQSLSHYSLLSLCFLAKFLKCDEKRRKNLLSEFVQKFESVQIIGAFHSINGYYISCDLLRQRLNTKCQVFREESLFYCLNANRLQIRRKLSLKLFCKLSQTYQSNVVVQLSTMSQSTSPSEDRRNRVSRSFLSFLMKSVVSRDGTMSSFGSKTLY